MRRLLLLIALIILAPACGGSDARALPDSRDARASDELIRVGSIDFTESRVLAEVYAAVLEEAGFPVEVIHGIGSQEILQPAIEQGHLDLAPVYLGTSFHFLGRPGIEPPRSSEDLHQAVAALYAARRLVLLDHARAENKNEVVVTRDTAERHDLRTISDLAPVASRFVFGGPPECPGRPLCLLGLHRVYGLDFGDFRPLDVGGPATVAALRSHEVDVGVLFTTNPSLSSRDLVVLRDDRELQPHENVAIIVRLGTLDGFGSRVAEVLGLVQSRLGVVDMRYFNEEVDRGGRDPREVARDWLERKGLGRTWP